MPDLVTCPHCDKRNPLPIPASAKIDTCQWCHREYELIGGGQAVIPAPKPQAPEPEAPRATLPCTKCGATLPPSAMYCHACGEAVPEPDAASQAEALRREVSQLRGEVESLRSAVEAIHLPQTDILSDSFWTRAVAIFGHSLALQIVLTIALYVLLFAITGAVAVGR